jgi:hypothetical protein
LRIERLPPTQRLDPRGGFETTSNHFRERFSHMFKGRNIIDSRGTFELREHQSTYSAVFDPKNASLRPENMYFGNTFDEISI